MAYRLNLYRDGKLISTEPVDVSLSEAKEMAIAAVGGGAQSDGCKPGGGDHFPAFGDPVVRPDR